MTSPTTANARSPTYTISILIYGRGDAVLGDGPSDSHLRAPLAHFTDFIYNPRIQPREEPVLRGYCELNGYVTGEDKDRAVRLLTDFVRDQSHIPEFGVGNCQDWVVDAVAMLERAELVREGEGVFWKGTIDLSAYQMEIRCLETGRRWVGRSVDEFEGVPDARFADDRGRPDR